MDPISSTSHESQEPLLSPNGEELGLPVGRGIGKSSPRHSKHRIPFSALRPRSKLLSLFLILFATTSIVLGLLRLGFLRDWTSLIPRDSAWSHEAYIRGPPTGHFRENLVDGIEYVTAWPIEGFTNQFIAQINLLLLAFLSKRIPIMPPFVVDKRHFGVGNQDNTLPLAVSEVFDLQKLASQLRRPVLEWRDVKNISLGRTDDVGCWSVFNTTHRNAIHFDTEKDLFLDVSLTRVPESAKLTPTAIFVNIAALASLGWREARDQALGGIKPISSPLHKHNRQPDEQMLCFDNLYYVGAAVQYEFEKTWAPAWNLIGQYMEYSPGIQKLARSLISKTFDLTDSDPFPKYISIHVRHTDFDSVCKGQRWDPCFPPLRVYQEHVKNIQDILRVKTGVLVDKVLVTSDEKNQTWWDDVRNLGWKTLDHKAEIDGKGYGAWFPTIMDTVALSLASGFIGTRGSTMSLIAGRRVELWLDGPTRFVAIGPH